MNKVKKIKMYKHGHIRSTDSTRKIILLLSMNFMSILLKLYYIRKSICIKFRNPITKNGVSEFLI